MQTSGTQDDYCLLTTAEAARFLRIHPRTLSRYAREGRVPVIRLSVRDYRFRRSSLEAFVQRSELPIT